MTEILIAVIAAAALFATYRFGHAMGHADATIDLALASLRELEERQ
ncbi:MULTISPECIES: hypothetical protein [Nonomuraea]|nr:hypothetical protein [Nonomuraea typhae]